MSEFLEVALQAARAGADVLLDWRGRIDAKEKAPKDLVTEADLASQQVIREILLGAFPDHAFVGEEDLGSQPPGPQQPVSARGRQDGYCWIVDPLDGTANYVHQLPAFAVSIALRRGDQIVAGVVLDPSLDECFHASLGQGVFLNGRPIQASGCTHLQEALVAASFSPDVPRGSPEVSRFVEVLHESRTLRRLGSAALNLCYVAAGRLDAYWATSVKIWDVAAGVLFLQEAGAVITAFDGSPFDLDNPAFTAAATERLHARLVEVLSRAA